MAKSTKAFDRWLAHESSTWAIRVFLKYDTELLRMWGTHLSSHSYTYSSLGKHGAKWEDKPRDHFDTHVRPESFVTSVKDWSQSFNRFSNWVNLSFLMSLSSNFETYLASVIRLAIESDPGLLFGASRSIDGAYIQKRGSNWVVEVNDLIEACTVGDWSSRFNGLRKIFGSIPSDLEATHADLEELRRTRNRIGHAMGRDIETVRKTATLEIHRMESVSRHRLERLHDSVLRGAKSLDHQLLSNHIGEFEAISFYARIHPGLNQNVGPGQRAMYLKKQIGDHGAVPRGKLHCNGLVDYWENL